jgi:hypothetical protein
MSSFNLVLDTTPVMLLQLAGHGVSRGTAFKVIDRIQSLAIVPVGVDVLYQPIVSVVEPLGDMDVFIVDPYLGVADDQPAFRWVDNTLCCTGNEALDALYSEQPCLEAVNEFADYDAIYGVCEYWND